MIKDNGYLLVDMEYMRQGYVPCQNAWKYDPERARKLLAIEEFKRGPVPETIPELYAKMVELLGIAV